MLLSESVVLPVEGVDALSVHALDTLDPPLGRSTMILLRGVIISVLDLTKLGVWPKPFGNAAFLVPRSGVYASGYRDGE